METSSEQEDSALSCPTFQCWFWHGLTGGDCNIIQDVRTDYVEIPRTGMCKLLHFCLISSNNHQLLKATDTDIYTCICIVHCMSVNCYGNTVRDALHFYLLQRISQIMVFLFHMSPGTTLEGWALANCHVVMSLYV